MAITWDWLFRYLADLTNFLRLLMDAMHSRLFSSCSMIFWISLEPRSLEKLSILIWRYVFEVIDWSAIFIFMARLVWWLPLPCLHWRNIRSSWRWWNADFLRRTTSRRYDCIEWLQIMISWIVLDCYLQFSLLGLCPGECQRRHQEDHADGHGARGQRHPLAGEVVGFAGQAGASRHCSPGHRPQVLDDEKNIEVS